MIRAFGTMPWRDDVIIFLDSIMGHNPSYTCANILDSIFQEEFL